MTLDFNALIDEKALSLAREREFPRAIRELVEDGATDIEFVVDSASALRIAAAIEMYTMVTNAQ